MSESCPINTCGNDFLARKQQAIGTIIELEGIASEALSHHDNINAGRMYGIVEEIQLDYAIPSYGRSTYHTTSAIEAEARDIHDERTQY